MSKPLCIYHGGCFDGFTSAWAVWKRFGDAWDYHAGVYGEEPPDVTGRPCIAIVDFSYKRPVLDSMTSRAAGSILVLDHHKTAAEELAGLPSPHPDNPYHPLLAVFDMDRSGAGITWDYFHEGAARPRFVDHVEDRDLWRFKLPGTREIHAAMSAYPFTFDAWEAIAATDIAELVREGAAIDRKHKRDIETLLPIHKRRMRIGGHEVWVANMPMTMTSDAGHALAKGEAFGACYWDVPAGRVFSLRSTDEGLDVSEVAKAYGGGGHRNAAGFQLAHGVEP